MRRFAADGFELEVPDDWLDRSVYTYRGPDGEFQPLLAIVPDPGTRYRSAEAYGRRQLRVSVANASGARILKTAPIELGKSGVSAFAAEMRWYPADEVRIYQRSLFVLGDRIAFTLACGLSKKARSTVGPAVDRVMRSFRPAGATPAPRGETFAGAKRVRADGFTMLLPEEWTDETVIALSEGDPSRFCRTFVVTRQPLDGEAPPVEELVNAQVEHLRSNVEGFELIDQGSFRVRDSEPAHRVLFARKTDHGASVLQEIVVAPRGRRVFTMVLTIEPHAPRSAQRQLASMSTSFRAEPVDPAAAGP